MTQQQSTAMAMAITPDVRTTRGSQTGTAGVYQQNLYRAPQPKPAAEQGRPDQLGAGRTENDSGSYGTYLFGDTYADPSRNEQGQAVAANWSSYTLSRIGVRLFSRGLMGATLYTLANRYVPKGMAGYTEHGAIDPTKPLHYLARGFDIVYGKPIQFYARQYFKWAGKTGEALESAVKRTTTFRHRRQFGEIEGGRSLGAEIVAMTTDFAAGSIGDSTGRSIANAFDPNYRNSWQRDDGSIDWQEFMRSNAKTAWRILSKNQGEDWAVALPYVYQMKWQRTALNRAFRGFSMSSDYGLNGGSWRVNERGDIVGSYAVVGALDLQARFTGYNIFTLMYRDFYDKVADVFHNGWQSPIPDNMPESGIPLIDPIVFMARYAIKSAIKATIYMTPAVPFFWITRTPQTKAHGIGVLVENDSFNSISKERLSLNLAAGETPFNVKYTRGVFDRAITPFGKACYKTAEAVNKAAHMLGVPEEHTRMGFGFDKPKTFAEDWVNASLSYTPYMIAKAETALRWDRPKDADGLNGMDRAIYRFLDGAIRLNIGEVKGGLFDIREQIIHPETNLQIRRKTEQKAAITGQKAPDTKVREVTEQDAVVVVKQPKARKSENADNGYTTNFSPKESYKNNYLYENFHKNPLPERGTTIH